MNNQKIVSNGLENIFDTEKIPKHIDVSLVGELGFCEESCFQQPANNSESLLLR